MASKWEWGGIKQLSETKLVTMALWQDDGSKPVLSIFNGDLNIPDEKDRCLIRFAPELQHELDKSLKTLQMIKNNFGKYLEDGDVKSDIMRMLGLQIDSAYVVLSASQGDEQSAIQIQDK